MELKVLTLDGKADGSVTLKDDIFGLEPRTDILHRMVRYQQLKAMAGTHDVKNRSEGVRTGKKFVKQKGSGGARHGDRKAPQFRGGGRAFGPTPRSHAIDLPKKVRALALKHAHPAAEVWATDVSGTALDLARRNARRLGLPLVVRRSDLLDDPEVAAAAGRAVAVVSNPPYLPAADRGSLPPEVAGEPPEALFAGADGLEVARRLVGQLAGVLRPGTLLALELDPRNARDLAAALGGWGSVRLESDLAGRERFVVARR